MTGEPEIPAGFLSEWCATLAVGTEMPPSAYLATGLVTVAALCGPRLFMRFSHTRQERCNLWVLNVGRSALARKTTGMSAAKWAMKVAGETLGDQVRWYGAKRISDAQMAVDLDVVSVDTERAAKAEEAAAKAERREAQAVEVLHRGVPVSWVLSLNEVASLWGEGLRDWQQATQSFLLDIFDGELASNTRSTFVPQQETFVCAIGNIPPAELVARTSFGQISSGFVGRWLMLPTPAPDHPISFPCLNGKEPIARLAQKVSQLAELARVAHPVDVRTLWTAGALEIHAEWYERWWRELQIDPAESREASARADLWGRLQATAKKLAAIVAVAREFDELERLHEVRVGVADVAWAQERVEVSIHGILDVVRESGGGASSVVGKVENRIIHYLQGREAQTVESAIPISRVGDAVKNSDARSDVNRAIEGLIGGGLLEMKDGVVGPAGGRPARVVWLAR